jgi:hypothetical protein
MLKRLIFWSTAALLLGGTASAAEPPPTGGDLAACAKAVDQPICLLRIAAHRPHQPYRYDIRLAYSRDVLAAIGDDVAVQVAADRMDRLGISAEAMTVDRQGLANALEADRRGASPAAALALVQVSHARPGMQAAPPELAKMLAVMEQMPRAGADEAIFNAYAGPNALPAPHRPSLGLVKAALADWEKLADQWSDEDRDLFRMRLAQAYLTLGDAAAAQRVDARMTGLADLRQGWSALHAGRLDAAAALAIKASPSGKPDDWEDYKAIWDLRAAVIQAAEAAGRRDLAARIAQAELALALAPKAESATLVLETVDADAAMADLVRDGNKPEIAAWSAKLDAAGRDHSSQQSAKNAVAATRGWIAVAAPERAKALALDWAPEHAHLDASCPGDKAPDCARHAVKHLPVELDADLMLTRALTPREQAAAGLRPYTALSLDLEDGRGVTGLATDLQASPPAEQLDLLEHCARLGGEKGQIGSAQICLNLALKFVPPKSYYGRHPVSAPDTSSAAGLGQEAMVLAAAAAGAGQLKAMHGDLDLALDLFGRSPAEPFFLLDADKLEDIAIAELREQGRL